MITVKDWYLAKKKLLNSDKNCKIVIKVLGQSMEPVLCKGDMVEIIGLKYKEMKIGDIIVHVHWQTNATIHRLVKIDKINELRFYKTKGDANPVSDDYILVDEEIIGVVIRIIKQETSIANGFSET
jgi:signal peptidase I